MGIRIEQTEVDNWLKCSKLWKLAEDTLATIEQTLLLEMHQTDGKAVEAIDKAMEAVNGNAYMFTPQTEWIGGDSGDENNHVATLPHIAK